MGTQSKLCFHNLTRRLGSHLPPPCCQECSRLRHSAPDTTMGCQL